jgi:hypothetical protein
MRGVCPSVDELSAQNLTLTERTRMGVLHGYLVLAKCPVIAKVGQMTFFK